MKRSPCAPRENIKLLVVDDDALTRDGLKAALSAEDGFVVSEASDGHKALQYFKEDRPDVVLLDLRMPGMDGLETMRELQSVDDRVPVVIMTAYGDIASAVEAMKSGAYDFIVKPPKPDRLIETLRNAAETSAKKASTPDEGAPETLAMLERYNSLTDREREVLKLTAGGLDRNEIAERLAISPRTVEYHREHAMQKMNVHNKAGLVLCATRLGILR